MRTGRPRAAIPTVEWKHHVRADLAAQVELILADPMRERVKYGARSRLLEQLLEEWLAKQRVNPTPPPMPISAEERALITAADVVAEQSKGRADNEGFLARAYQVVRRFLP